MPLTAVSVVELRTGQIVLVFLRPTLASSNDYVSRFNLKLLIFLTFYGELANF